MDSASQSSLLSVNDLHTHFFTRQGVVKAANGVTFSLAEKSILGLVGESGCGKSVTVLSIMRLIRKPGKIVAGEIHFNGRDLLALPDEEMRQIRGKEVSMIFQNPMSALNPILPIGTQVQETITSHLNIPASEARSRAIEILRSTGLPNPEKLIHNYPFQMSGGMCQRIMIAIAMALQPKLLIADEPTSNLDVTIQAEILEEIGRLREELGSSVILITHNFGVVARMAERMAVMYAGYIIECGDVKKVFERPAHPYTWGLLNSLPRIDVAQQPLRALKGTPPNLIDPPEECPFIPRCPKALNMCRQSPRPVLENVDDNHLVACYNPVQHNW